MTNLPKVCLVLGAGASRPYGYPLGWQLKERIVQYCLSKPGDCAPSETLPQTHQLLEEFAQRFDSDESSTVDAFLTKLAAQGDRERELSNHGRMAIVAVLSTYERAHDPRTGWYDELSRLLNSSAGPPPLRVVTFNYDRSLEFFVSRNIEVAEASHQPVKERFRQLVEIKHVYGQIADSTFEYGQITGHGKWTGGLEKISLIGETPNDEVVRTCKAWINESDFLIVLGFGFHHVNLNLIGLDNLPAAKLVFCSAYGLDADTRSRVRWSCAPARIHFGRADTPIAPFLQRSKLLNAAIDREPVEHVYARLGPGIA